MGKSDPHIYTHQGGILWFRLLALWMSLLSMQCGRDNGGSAAGLSLDIHTQGIPLDTTSLEVAVTLNGKPNANGPFNVTRELDHFVVSLPSGTQGLLRLHISALRSDGCGVGKADQLVRLGYVGQLAGQPSDLSADGSGSFLVALVPEESPCSLKVKFAGSGNKTVTSLPSGINCQYQCVGDACQSRGACSAVFPASQQVRLLASGDTGTILSDWFGACEGSRPCNIGMRGDAKEITAAVADQLRCTDSNWCDELPQLPCNGDTTAIWMNGDDDVLIAKKGCGLSRYHNGVQEIISTPFPINQNAFRGIWSDRPDNVWAIGDDGVIYHGGRGSVGHAVKNRESLVAIIGCSLDSVAGIQEAIAISSTGVVFYIQDTKDGLHVVRSWTLDKTSSQTDGQTLHALWSDGLHDFWIAGDMDASSPYTSRVYHLSLGQDRKKWIKELETGWQTINLNIFAAITDIAGTARDDVWFLGSTVTSGGRLFHYDGNQLSDTGFDETVTTFGLSGALAAVRRGQVWILARRLFFWNYDLAKHAATMLGLPRCGDGVNCAVISGHSSTIQLASWDYKGNITEHWQWLTASEKWQPWQLPSTNQAPPTFVSVFGASSTDIWFIDQNGDVYRRDSAGLHAIDLPHKINQGWAQNSQSVWLVGNTGVIYYYDGEGAHEVPSGTSADLHTVWGTNFDNVWAGGTDNTILHWDGSWWRPTPIELLSGFSGSPDYRSIAGSGGNNLWAVGGISPDQTAVLKWHGREWRQLDLGDQLQASDLPRQLLVRGQDDFWFTTQNAQRDPFVYHVVGKEVSLVRFPDGSPPSNVWGDSSGVYVSGSGAIGTESAFRLVDFSTSRRIYSVWGEGNDIWAVGEQGTILRYRPLGTN